MNKKDTPLYRLFKVIYFMLGIPVWIGVIFFIYTSFVDGLSYEFLLILIIYLVIIGGLKFLVKYIMLGSEK